MRIDLQLKCNKKETLESIRCYENSPYYSDYEELFYELLEENKDILKPVGYYIITDQKSEEIQGDYEQWVYCIVTLGKAVDLRMKSYFDADDYMKGVLMSSIADTILFSASNDLYQSIFSDVKASGMMMTKRKEPGTSDVPVTAQKVILDIINAKEQTDISITSGYMLNPTKSTAYLYGAGKDLQYTPFDHDCSLCDHVNCQHRKVYVTAKIDDNEKVITVKSGSNLMEVLRENNIPIQADCSGNGTCGKCKVKVLSGQPRLSEEELILLTKEEIAEGMVLGCYQKVSENIVLEIKRHGADILTDFNFPALVERKYEIIEIAGISKRPDSNLSATEIINHNLGIHYRYSLPALRQLSDLLSEKSFFALVKNEEQIVRIQQKKLPFYGIGVDIGTTTIVIALIDLMEEKVVSVYKSMNPQKAYGADVISRIQYITEHDKSALTNIIQEAILEGISKLMKTHQILENQIAEVAIAGNTTMQYLLAGINPRSLSIAPFLTTYNDAIKVTFSDLFKDNRLSCEVDIMPVLSAYIGADIMSGLYTTDLAERSGNYLLIDMGTNGELAIKVNNRIICVSTAAGPAFEGANITCGMGSFDGAISGVAYDNHCFKLEIIGDLEPRGICGSGLIDLIAICLEEGLIDKTGRIVQGEAIPISAENKGIVLYQSDIRELQLAKAAIAAGIQLLLEISNCQVDDLDGLLLAGGFGHHLNVEHAIRIGLLPEGLRDKTKIIGNSSLGGSIRYLLEMGAHKKISNIKNQCEYIELSTNALFYDYFIESMNFNSREED
jgi:uncharacterized 2Fe-2S/4Fe-4S cluster protein (DUF4445 family)